MAKAIVGDDNNAVIPGKQKPKGSLLDVIVSVAKHYKIPPELALAIAQHESGFNTHAVGDNGTSFGLYQLHQGGELPAGKDAVWAADPKNNAMVALKVVAQVYHRNPNLDWGTIAALAQRPANPQAYAQNVNDILKRSGRGQQAYHYFSAAVADSQTHPYDPTDWSAAHTDTAKAGSQAGATPKATATSTANNIGFSTATGGGGSGTGGAASTIGVSSTPEDFEAQLNAAGFAKALLNSDPTLKKVFDQAISQGWYKSTTGLDRFQAAIRNTQWWTKRSDTQRTFDERAYSDSTGLHQEIGKQYDDIVAQAKSLGVTLNPSDAWNMAKAALRNGMSPQEISNAISTHLTYNGGTASGSTGVAVDQIKSLASSYYVPTTNAQLQDWSRQIAAGTMKVEDLTDYFKNQALASMPYLQKQLDSGLTVKQIADTYKAQMAQTLELAPDAIQDQDPTIMKALQFKDDKGQVGLMPLYQYDQMLKADPRWNKTEQAHNTYMGITSSLLKTWGLQT